MAKLTTRQTNALKKHSKHHTSKHMTYMKNRMSRGDTFTQAHNKAMKKVGR